MRGLNLTDVHDCGMYQPTTVLSANRVKGWVICASPWIVGICAWLITK